jgi:PAS domain S-box-containing protein
MKIVFNCLHLFNFWHILGMYRGKQVYMKKKTSTAKNNQVFKRLAIFVFPALTLHTVGAISIFLVYRETADLPVERVQSIMQLMVLFYALAVIITIVALFFTYRFFISHVRLISKHIAEGTMSDYNGLSELVRLNDQINQTLKKSLETTQLLNRIIYTVGALIVVIDSKGNIIKFNKKCEEITGLERTSVENEFIWNFLSDDNKKPEMEALLEVLLNSIISTSFESQSIMKGGRDNYILWNNTTIKDEDDTIKWTIGTGIDITDQKRAEQELKKLNSELEQRISERTMQLQEMIDRLQRTLKELKDTQAYLIKSEKLVTLGSLVEGIAHDIDTPISIGAKTAEYVLDRVDTLKSDYARGGINNNDLGEFLSTASEMLTLLRSNFQIASNLINSFKNIASDQSNDEVRTFNVKTYCDDILKSLQSELKKQNHTVSVQCPDDLEITSYPGPFSQVISQLVLNSLQHAFDRRTSGRIEITISYSEPVLSIDFKDNGKGIEEELLDRIFDPFTTSGHDENSSGLGLYIVYMIVTQTFRGSIECLSKPGDGTRFLIELKDPQGVDSEKEKQ